jgi:hypothetical protein
MAELTMTAQGFALTDEVKRLFKHIGSVKGISQLPVGIRLTLTDGTELDLEVVEVRQPDEQRP